MVLERRGGKNGERSLKTSETRREKEKVWSQINCKGKWRRCRVLSIICPSFRKIRFKEISSQSTRSKISPVSKRLIRKANLVRTLKSWKALKLRWKWKWWRRLIRWRWSKRRIFRWNCRFTFLKRDEERTYSCYWGRA